MKSAKSDDFTSLDDVKGCLRDRIANALWNHPGAAAHTHRSARGSCPERLVDGQLRGECYWRQADAVIAELGLRREELSETGSSVLFNDNRPHHRYVTDWEADDE